MIIKFGGYGFNKSHSAAYAHISYHTAYLKCHYTPEFMAALLSSESDDGNKRDIMVEHIADARKFGVQVLPPDVNRGEPDFAVINGQIQFGLVAIKGLGRGAAEEILKARIEKGPFKDVYDFCERVDSKIVGRAPVEKLIKAGAMDDFARPFAHRAQLLAALPSAMGAAEERQADRRKGQGFFDFGDVADEADGNASPAVSSLPTVPRWTPTEQLKAEKEALDFYFSSHPLTEVDGEMRRYSTTTIGQIRELDEGQEVRIGGMMTQVRYFNSKKGDRYVRCKIEDFTGQTECVMWPSDFTRYKEAFADDKIYLYEAKVEWGDREDPMLVLSRLLTLDDAKKELTRGMILRLALGRHGPEAIDGLETILRRPESKGGCIVYLLVRDSSGRQAQLRLGDEYCIHPGKVPVSELEMLLGEGAVMFTGRM